MTTSSLDSARVPRAYQALVCLLLLSVGCATSPPRATTSTSPPPGANASGSRHDTADRGKGGRLRVLVHAGATHVPRTGSPADRELAAIELFARSRSLELELVPVANRSALIDALLAGRGDVIAAHLTNTPTRRARVRFSRPLRTVRELVVAPAEATGTPRSLDDLAGRTLHLRPSSSFMESLLSKSLPVPPRIAPLDETLDALDILAAVGRGDIPLTVMDSDAVDAYRAYRSDIQVVAELSASAPIAWAVRPDAEPLLQAINAFLSDYISRTDHQGVAAVDLDAIKARGVLRMVLPNTGAAFFFHQGVPMGFQYVLAQKLCTKLGVRLEVVVPRQVSDMLPLLVEGHADVIAATLTVTTDRQALVDFAEPLMRVDEVLVQSSRTPPLRSVRELEGRTVVVLEGSSYLRTLAALQASVSGLKVQVAPTGTSSDDLIDGVARGTYDLTVSDYNLIAGELSFRTDIIASLRLGRGRPIAYAVRRGSPRLKAALDEFSRYWAPQLAETAIGTSTPVRPSPPSTPAGARTPFDAEVAAIASAHSLPADLLERWMMAVSSGDPNTVSWFGARGLLQVMPHIATEFGATAESLNTPRIGLDVGARWLLALRARLPKEVPADDAMQMALAATRVGFGHISDARELAVRNGWDPNRWDGHVARALSELTRPEVAAGARYGYCPGTEAVRFVARVLP